MRVAVFTCDCRQGACGECVLGASRAPCAARARARTSSSSNTAGHAGRRKTARISSSFAR
eukprot:3398771-Prymnesium_polylepis.1